MRLEKRILRVNLGTGGISTEAIPEDWVLKYFGCKGLGLRYLIEEVPKGTDPLSEENRLIFMDGLMAGTIVPNSNKIAVITKSPATQGLTDGSMGGAMAAELKYAGYDGIVLEGKASRPVYLLINNNQVELCDAMNLWGRGCHETEVSLHAILGRDFKVCSIGPAGENLVPFACITSELYRQSGRGEVGAVMGSKNLKAIVVRGSGDVEVPDVKGLMKEMRRLLTQDILTSSNLWSYDTGTPMLVEYCNDLGILPTRNFRYGIFENFNEIGSEAVLKYRKRKKTCFGCAIGCANWLRIGDLTLEGPEYETLALAGSNCAIGNLEAISKFNKDCDDLGLDTISAGNVVGLAMDMTELGVHNFGIKFGEEKRYLEMPRLIARKEGIGADLAQGARTLTKQYGVPELAMETKGLEYPGYDPRGSWGMGLAYATSDRGACHMRAWTISLDRSPGSDPYAPEGKAQIVIERQDHSAAKYSAGICAFWNLNMDILSQVVNAYFGESLFDGPALYKLGERIYNLGRMINVREGLLRKDDNLPSRIVEEVLMGGRASGQRIPAEAFDHMLSEYYKLRGWDKEGIPMKQTLKRLEIEEGLAASIHR
jgi:aldehyde:ferredoxin oxidoreductase